MKLKFPENDIRSNGKSFNPERPWLKQGAIGKVIITPVPFTCKDPIYKGRSFRPRYVVAVRFKDSKSYDLVSSEFIKK